MPYLNRTAFIGNLTKAPELRFQSNGEKQALCLLNLALNRDSRDENGEKRTHTTFINDIEVWGLLGETCARFLTSGSMVLVEGRLDVDQWQDKTTGSRRSRVKIVGDNVQFLRIKRPEEEAPGDPSFPSAPPPPEDTLATEATGTEAHAAVAHGVHEPDFDAAPAPAGKADTRKAGSGSAAGRTPAPSKSRHRPRPEPAR